MTSARTREGGYTLTEVLVAVVIVTIAVTAIVGAFSSIVLNSAVHRDQVTSDVVVRTYAEQLVQAPYQAYAGTQVRYADMTGAPGGFKATNVNVLCWDGAPAVQATFANCATTGDNGMQLLTLRASRSNGSRPQQVQIIKRQP